MSNNSRFSLPNLLMKKKQAEQTDSLKKLLTAIDKTIREQEASVAEVLEVFQVLTSGYQIYSAKKTILKFKEKSNDDKDKH